MNVDKMTERVREALSDAFTRAMRARNPSVEPDHIFAALLEQPDGIVPAVAAKAGGDLPHCAAPSTQRWRRCPAFPER